MHKYTNTRTHACPQYSGAFASVKKCVNRRTGELYAMKIIDRKRLLNNIHSTRKDTFKDEVLILQQLDHPHIIGIEDFYVTDANLYIVLELVHGGDLFDRVSMLMPISHRTAEYRCRPPLCTSHCVQFCAWMNVQ